MAHLIDSLDPDNPEDFMEFHRRMSSEENMKRFGMKGTENSNITYEGLRKIIAEHDRIKASFVQQVALTLKVIEERTRAQKEYKTLRDTLDNVYEGLYHVFGQDEAADLMLVIDKAISSLQEGVSNAGNQKEVCLCDPDAPEGSPDRPGCVGDGEG